MGTNTQWTNWDAGRSAKGEPAEKVKYSEEMETAVAKLKCALKSVELGDTTQIKKTQ